MLTRQLPPPSPHCWIRPMPHRQPEADALPKRSLAAAAAAASSTPIRHHDSSLITAMAHAHGQTFRPLINDSMSRRDFRLWFSTCRAQPVRHWLSRGGYQHTGSLSRPGSWPCPSGSLRFFGSESDSFPLLLLLVKRRHDDVSCDDALLNTHGQGLRFHGAGSSLSLASGCSKSAGRLGCPGPASC